MDDQSSCTTSTSRGFVRKLSEVDPVRCPCGEASRIITRDDNDVLSIHRVKIEGKAEKHFHKRLTEYYVILSGTGFIELQGDSLPVEAGDVVWIPPGVEHALKGHFEIINIVTPPFDPLDEYRV